MSNIIKRADAEDIAAAESFAWSYEAAEDDELYDAIEALGYTWDEDEERWIGPEVMQRHDEDQVQRDREALMAWNAGKPIKGTR